MNKLLTRYLSEIGKRGNIKRNQQLTAAQRSELGKRAVAARELKRKQRERDLAQQTTAPTC